MSTLNHDAPRPAARTLDWTEQVDRFLDRVRGMSAAEAASRFGLGKEAILSWRRKRGRGERVTGLRARHQEALTRALEQELRSATIPIPIPAGVKLRRGAPS